MGAGRKRGGRGITEGARPAEPFRSAAKHIPQPSREAPEPQGCFCFCFSSCSCSCLRVVHDDDRYAAVQDGVLKPSRPAVTCRRTSRSSKLKGHQGLRASEAKRCPLLSPLPCCSLLTLPSSLEQAAPTGQHQAEPGSQQQPRVVARDVVPRAVQHAVLCLPAILLVQLVDRLADAPARG